MVILKNGKRSQPHMMYCPTKTKEKCTTMVVKKVYNKEEPAVAMATSSHKCLEVVVAEQEDHKRERVFNMQLRLLLKKYIKERQVRLLSIEIESAQVVPVRVVKMELMPLAALVKEEEWLPRWFNLDQACTLNQLVLVIHVEDLAQLSENKTNVKNAMVRRL